MNATHIFLFNPGQWVGEGTITFSASPEELYFVTQWEVAAGSDQEMTCQQEVRMEGADEPTLNRYHISDITPQTFRITLENNIVGKVNGTGVIDEKTIAWEFREQIGFQGYEVYEAEGEGLYKFHAEYASPDQFRTTIDGHIRLVDENGSE